MLSGTGVWSSELRYGDPVAIAAAAAELESFGYSALWVPDVGGDVFASLDVLLGATSTITVATGILNIWRQTPEAANAWWSALAPAHRDRTLLGLGVSHGPFIGAEYTRPLAAMEAFIDALVVPAEHLCVAALGPKMLELARERTAGTHPYLVTPEHTVRAREAVGPDGLVAPEQGVVLDTDATAAPAVARQALGIYATLPNYVGNWKRLGFTDDDVASLSDPLVDALVTWGDVATIAARVAEHRAAGADHVCLQVLQAPGQPLPLDAWRALAEV